MFYRLATGLGAILILLGVFFVPSCAPQSQPGDSDKENNVVIFSNPQVDSDKESNVVIFSNPPESQRFKGWCGLTLAAQRVIEFDHYLTGYKSDSPSLYVEYTNITNHEVKIEIGIMWVVSSDDIVRQTGQHDIRPSISPGQSERLIYRPIVESPSEIVDYSIEVHSLLDEQLPHISFGPQVSPEQVPPSPAESLPQTGKETPSAIQLATKAELVQALNDLKEVMATKIDIDIDTTANTFVSVKDYWRVKRIADIVRAPLSIMEDTISLLAKAADLITLSQAIDAALDQSETTYEILTTIMMVQDLQQVGENLHYGLDGPTYTLSIEKMLETADATFVPPTGDNWQKYYKQVINNYLYGPTDDSPLVIPRKSVTAERKNIEFVKSALLVRTSITHEFDKLIGEIEATQLPQGFPTGQVVSQIEELKKEVVASTGNGIDVRYKTYLDNQEVYVDTKLGAIGEYNKTFADVALAVSKKLDIETKVEVLQLVEAGESAALLYTISYSTPGAQEFIKVTQKATILPQINIESFGRTFYTNSETEFYMIPQEMVLILPTELSNLWMIADDTDQYVRYLMKANKAAN